MGYQRVRLASGLNAGLAAADTLGFYVALHVAHLELRAVGIVALCTCSAAAIFAILAVLSLPPEPSVRVCCGTSGSGGEGGDGCGAAAASLASLARDSLNVLIRSLLLSSSVLTLTVASAPLGTATLNASAIVLQLWMLTSYFVDGFADVGTMVGSRLLGAGESRALRTLTAILAALGIGVGLLASGALLTQRRI